MFDSLKQFLENAAAWGVVQGWRYVAVGDFAVDSVVGLLGDVNPDVSASGKSASWWIGDDRAISVQQYLNPARSRYPQVCVLAKTPIAASEMGGLLPGLGVEPAALKAAKIFGFVPGLPSV